MENITTAEERVNEMFSYGRCLYNQTEIKREMIEFAKLHVEAALEAASENVEVECDSSDVFQSVNERSILYAYPSTNIK